MSVALLITALQIVSLIGSGLTAAKLFVTGLYRKYRFFFWYFLFRIPNTLWPLFLNRKSALFYYFWISTEPITWLFHTAVVLELYRLVLEKHKGLYTLGRWALFAGIGTSVTISVASLIPRLSGSASKQSLWMARYIGMERGLMLGLAIFLLFMMGFLLLYTVPISRNVKMHARIYTVFFLSNSLAFLFAGLLDIHFRATVNVALEVVSVACVFAWLFLLSPQGEEVKSSNPVLGPEHERRLLQQLDALNATLLKVSRN